MTHHILLFVFAVLFLGNTFLSQPAAAQVPTPVLGESVHQLLAFNPSEIGRKMSDSFNRMKEGLHPVVVMMIYIGLVFIGLVVFTAFVILMFIFIMMIRR